MIKLVFAILALGFAANWALSNDGSLEKCQQRHSEATCHQALNR